MHDILAVDTAKMAVNYGAGEILLNSVERDGTMIGYDLQLIEKISKEVSVPVIATGGCGCVDDFSQAVRAGASAVAAGSIFHWVGESIISIKRHMDDQGISVRLL
jgi:cyclase